MERRRRKGNGKGKRSRKKIIISKGRRHQKKKERKKITTITTKGGVGSKRKKMLTVRYKGRGAWIYMCNDLFRERFWKKNFFSFFFFFPKYQIKGRNIELFLLLLLFGQRDSSF